MFNNLVAFIGTKSYEFTQHGHGPAGVSFLRFRADVIKVRAFKWW